jgi:hypothetical protein
MARGTLHAYNWEGRRVCIVISTMLGNLIFEQYIYKCINSVHK